jgi:glutaredoxin
VDYRRVDRDKGLLEEMLKHTKGKRQVPVLVEAQKVTIGFGGS